MGAGRNREYWLVILILLFAAGIAGGYLYFSRWFAPPHAFKAEQPLEEQAGDYLMVRVYIPFEGRLVMEERRLKRSDTTISETAVEEFLRGVHRKGKSDVPAGTKLLGLYRGSDGVLYVDLSDEFRRNFQGSAMTEFLLLKGLYETVISNSQGLNDVKILIEGKEIESIGGHMYALFPLKEGLRGMQRKNE